MNKPLPLFLNDLLSEIDCREDIPIYKGGPISTDTLFYLHTLENIADSLPIANGFYLNGDFAAIKQFMAEGNSIKRKNTIFPRLLRLGIRTAEARDRRKYLVGGQSGYSLAHG